MPTQPRRPRGTSIGGQFSTASLPRAALVLDPPARALAVLHPELVAEWDHDLNRRTPDQVTVGSGFRAHWICAAGHRWTAPVYSRTGGSGCPTCANRVLPTPGANDLATLHPELVAEWHPDLNDRTPDQVTAGSSYRATWVCAAGHRWQAVVASRSRGAGCPTCWALPTLGVNDLATTNPDLAAEWDHERNDRAPTEVTPGSKYEAHWICAHGHRYQARINSRKTQGCPYCSGKRPIPGVTDLATVNPDLVAEWDPDLNDKAPTEVTAGSGYRAHWICPAGHRWQVAVSERAKDGHGCRTCHIDRQLTASALGRDLATTHPHLAAEWDVERNDRPLTKVTAGSGYKAYWICARGHRWQAYVYNRANNGNGCPTCRWQ